MKKIAVIFLVLTALFAFASCGEDSKSASSKKSNSSTSLADNDTFSETDEFPESVAIPASSSKASTSSAKASTSSAKASTSSTKTEASSKASTAATGKMSLKDYVASQQSTLATMQESFQNMMTISLTAEGKSMVYTYKYTIDVGSIDLIRPSLEAQKDTLESTMKPLLTATKLVVDDIDSIIVKYLTKDNKEIITYEFKD